MLSIIDDVRQRATMQLDQSKRGAFGQYMTPAPTAELLASMFDNVKGELSLLDAGAGVGSLTAAFLQRVIREKKVTRLTATVYETDVLLASNLRESLKLFSEYAGANGIVWYEHIFTEDFIQNAVNLLQAKSAGVAPMIKFNRAILNPPYLKIGAKSRDRKLLRQVGIETGNLYSAFVALAIKLLEPGGELVAITPRSFCNGPYFQGFREILLEETALKKIRIFNSRTQAFKGDNVLQENVIFHLVKSAKQGDVEISSSTCAEDPDPVIRIAPFEEVVSTTNPGRFIHIVTTDAEAKIAAKVANLPASLSDIGLEVSTGKVVDFRTKENLRMNPEDNAVPLIYPMHLKNGAIKWPVENAKKPNALVNSAATANLMVPNGTYVITKRLTAKEEKRRIVASLYQSSVADVDVVGFENKTNYFHTMGKPLNDLVARGLWLFLNSSIIDQYFRQFNGHTQVNSTDLRTLRYPTTEQLKTLGRKAPCELPSQEKTDQIVGIIWDEQQSGAANTPA